MTLDVVLNWATRSLSFFNTVALLWLGLAVLLNADQRRWGTVLAGVGLVLGGIFFAGHTTIVARPFGTFDAEMEFWWRLGWIPFVSPPYVWYLVMAWYAGVLGTRLHRAAIIALGVVGTMALVLIFLAEPLPSYSDLLSRRDTPGVELGGIPTVVLLYPAYSVLCIILSLAALRRPSATARFMGDLARERARPWLVAASVVLLLVSLLVGAMASWIVRAVQAGDLVLLEIPTVTILKLFDTGISGLLALAIVLIGRAVASYEVFTGKTLPRGGLLRQWRNSLILAGSFALLMGVGLDVPVDPIFRLVLATVAITALYALHSWRVYADREESIERLRPFVASERLYDRLLMPSRAAAAPPTADAERPFRALCEDVLGARAAYLVALGPLGPLAGPPLAYPDGSRASEASAAALERLAPSLRSPQTMCVPLDPRAFAGAVWGVPLWSERGMVGVLLLGPKVDGGLYTQEEIEIARATGERLVDIQASSEMARRLIALQRERLAESQVMDARTRRALHDEILPRLHAALLTLSSAAVPVARSSGTRRDAGAALQPDAVADVATQIADAHRELADVLRAMPSTVVPRITQAGLIGALRQMIDGELGASFGSVHWDVPPEAERAARQLAPLAAEVLFGAAREAARNAARHGRAEQQGRPLNLTVAARADGERFELHVVDDGVGITRMREADAAPTFTAPVSVAPEGGHGLGLHSTLMAVIGGTLTLDSVSGSGTRVTLTLPT